MKRNGRVGKLLSVGERERLQTCEAVIAQGIATFIAVGRALSEISSNRLYRAEFSSFQDYCKERWGFNRAHAYRLISSAKVAEEMSPRGDTFEPTTEGQVRALVELPPDERIAVWKEACERANGKPPSTRLVAKVSGEHRTKTQAAGGKDSGASAKKGTPIPGSPEERERRRLQHYIRDALACLESDHLPEALGCLESASVLLQGLISQDSGAILLRSEDVSLRAMQKGKHYRDAKRS